MSAKIQIIHTKSNPNSVYQFIKIANGNYIRINSKFGKKEVNTAIMQGVAKSIATK